MKSSHVTITSLASGLAFAFLPPTGASADVTQCVPITVSGVSVACVSVSATQQPLPNGDEEVDATVTVQLDGQAPITQTVPVTLPLSVVPQVCTVSGQRAYPKSGQPDAYGYTGGGFFFGIGLQDSRGCQGLFGVVEEDGGAPSNNTLPTVGLGTPLGTIPVDIPQICLTTTGTCVGPYDGSITPVLPVVTPPTIDTGSRELCFGSFSASQPGDYTYDDSLCEVVPVGH